MDSQPQEKGARVMTPRVKERRVEQLKEEIEQLKGLNRNRSKMLSRTRKLRKEYIRTCEEEYQKQAEVQRDELLQQINERKAQIAALQKQRSRLIQELLTYRREKNARESGQSDSAASAQEQETGEKREPKIVKSVAQSKPKKKGAE